MVGDDARSTVVEKASRNRVGRTIRGGRRRRTASLRRAPHHVRPQRNGARRRHRGLPRCEHSLTRRTGHRRRHRRFRRRLFRHRAPRRSRRTDKLPRGALLPSLVLAASPPEHSRRDSPHARPSELLRSKVADLCRSRRRLRRARERGRRRPPPTTSRTVPGRRLRPAYASVSRGKGGLEV